MRIYLTVLVEELAAPTVATDMAFAVTPALAKANPEFTDEEDLEYLAFEYAKAACITKHVLAETNAGTSPLSCRAIVSADAPNAQVLTGPGGAAPQPPSGKTTPNPVFAAETGAVVVNGPLSWEQAVSIHVDCPEFYPVVAQAIAYARADDDSAQADAVFEALAAEALSWYDIGERSALLKQLKQQ